MEIEYVSPDLPDVNDPAFASLKDVFSAFTKPEELTAQSAEKVAYRLSLFFLSLTLTLTAFVYSFHLQRERETAPAIQEEEKKKEEEPEKEEVS